jgi:hypothetical protein
MDVVSRNLADREASVKRDELALKAKQQEMDHRNRIMTALQEVVTTSNLNSKPDYLLYRRAKTEQSAGVSAVRGTSFRSALRTTWLMGL